MSQMVGEINFRHLAIFYLFSRSEGAGQLSECIHIPKPTIYHAVREVERISGFSVYERGSNMVITEKGKVLSECSSRVIFHLSQYADFYHLPIGKLGIAGLLRGSQLRDLIELEQCRCFKTAAENLKKSEACVRRNILNLERFLDIKLFYRVQSMLTATNEARILALAAHRAYEELNAGIFEAASL